LFLLIPTYFSFRSYHPESWNPLWSVSTILTGLYSFMIESNPTLGSIETPLETKRKLAAQSLEYNVKNTPIFSKLFPEYVEIHKEAAKHRKEHPEPAVTAAIPDRIDMPQALYATMAGIVAIFSVFIAMRFL